jgi:hypothetical protein
VQAEDGLFISSRVLATFRETHDAGFLYFTVRKLLLCLDKYMRRSEILLCCSLDSFVRLFAKIFRSTIKGASLLPVRQHEVTVNCTHIAMHLYSDGVFESCIPSALAPSAYKRDNVLPLDPVTK